MRRNVESYNKGKYFLRKYSKCIIILSFLSIRTGSSVLSTINTPLRFVNAGQ